MTSSGTIYRSENGLLTNARGIRLARVIAVTLLLVGAGLVLVGIAGVVGIGSLPALATTLFFGLGLVGIGGGAFMLVLLEALRRDS